MMEDAYVVKVMPNDYIALLGTKIECEEFIKHQSKFDSLYKSKFEIQSIDSVNIMEVLRIAPLYISMRFMGHIYPLSIIKLVLEDTIDVMRKSTARMRNMMTYVEECKKIDSIDTSAIDTFIKDSHMIEHAISVKNVYDDDIDCRSIWNNLSD